jgi:hypothetical protein
MSDSDDCTPIQVPANERAGEPAVIRGTGGG